MTKNIALFLDGTWNKPDDPGAKDSKETTVRILYKMSYQNDDQKAYYDSGVGTEWYDDKIGGTTGLGLSQNIKQAYSKLCVLYENGDKIFLFGFSRGAFTARSLAGLVYHCGLIKGKSSAKAILMKCSIFISAMTRMRSSAAKRTTAAVPSK